ncbi:MAG: EF-hand domain-containing protein [Bacilli bacterium]
MAHEDRDGDGKVSRDEFRSSDHHFGHLDRNGDGYITKDKAPADSPPQRR